MNFGEHSSTIHARQVASVLSKSLGPLWTIARQAPLSMGFSRHEYWSELPCPYRPGESSQPSDQT